MHIPMKPFQLQGRDLSRKGFIKIKSLNESILEEMANAKVQISGEEKKKKSEQKLAYFE